MAESHASDLVMRVRFPLPAPPKSKSLWFASFFIKRSLTTRLLLGPIPQISALPMICGSPINFISKNVVPKILSFKQIVFLFLCDTLSYNTILIASKTASNCLNFIFNLKHNSNRAGTISII